MLVEVADGIVIGYGDRSCVRARLPEDDFEEGGFPMAVPSYKAHPFVGMDRETCVLEKKLPAIGFC